MKHYNVISVGSGLVDAFIPEGFKEEKGKISFLVGTKILIETIDFSTGGGGINSASCFSSLGLKTGFLAKIGGGYNGKIVLRELKKRKIDFLGVASKEHTGYSIILQSEKRNRTILTFKGASDHLKFSEVSTKKLNTKWFYFTSLGGDSFETQKKLALFARQKGIQIAYNPSSYHTRHGASYLKEILQNTTILSLNKEEAQMLVPKGDICRGLRALGPSIVCITDGENPGEVYDGKYLYRFFPYKVKVQEATGAGDIFGSSFVTGFLKTKNIEEAIRIAVTHAEAAICATDKDKRLLAWNDLLARVKKRPPKITKEAST